MLRFLVTSQKQWDFFFRNGGILIFYFLIKDKKMSVSGCKRRFRSNHALAETLQRFMSPR